MTDHSRSCKTESTNTPPSGLGEGGQPPRSVNTPEKFEAWKLARRVEELEAALREIVAAEDKHKDASQQVCPRPPQGR
jgi:hypothetical protein